jgi:VanZ family protein
MACCFTAIIIFLTHIPQDSVPPLLPLANADKFEHFAAYGTIALLFFLSLASSRTWAKAFVLLLIISCVGAVDELTQPLVNRTASLADWLANTVGVLSVILYRDPVFCVD